MNTTLSFTVLIFIAASLNSIKGLDLEAEIERQKKIPFCGALQPAPNTDVSWLRSKEYWYAVYWTKLEMLVTSRAFLNDDEYEDMTEKKAWEKICFRSNIDSVDSYGYGRRIASNMTSLFKIHFNPIRHGVLDMEYDSQYVLTTYFVMTDNKTFVVGVDVFADGTRGGYVMTPDTNESKFSEDQVLEWRNKLVEVGLEEGDFFHTPLDCNKKFGGDKETMKNSEASKNVPKKSRANKADL